MKSIYILTAILLVFSNSVLTADDDTKEVERHAEQALGLEAIDIILDTGVPFDAQTAFQLMDKLCRQVGNMKGIVSGALNIDTGEFKTWAEYTAAEGLNPNSAYHYATGPWQTFRGECMLRPQLTWWEHGHRSFGRWAENTGKRASSRDSPIKVHFAGFTTRTSMPSWVTKCENSNVDAMATLFRFMPGIPDDITKVWDGLERRAEEKRRLKPTLYLKPGERGRVIGTTNLRVVRAVQVFRVDEWYRYSDNRDRGFATTWRRLGPAWKYVYTDRAFVEARGLCHMFPSDTPALRTPVDPCLNLENKEVEKIDSDDDVSADLEIYRVEL